MNILILEEAEVGVRIPRADRRWEHIKKVLKKGPGDILAAGLADGALGDATILEKPLPSPPFASSSASPAPSRLRGY